MKNTTFACFIERIAPFPNFSAISGYTRLPDKIEVSLLVLILFLAAGLRLILFYSRPVLLTNDSHDYLLAALEITLDWRCPVGCYDWRLPGYLLFLAAALTVGHSLEVILGFQIGLGLLVVLLGFVVGRQAGSKKIGLTLAVYLAIHPVLIIFEHLILSETLFLLGVLTLTLVGWRYFLCPHSLRLTVATGGIAGGVTLIRANALIIYLVVILLIIARLIAISQKDGLKLQTIGLSLLVCLGSIAVIVAPWIYRNHTVYNVSGLTLNNNRNRLIYLDHHRLINPILPQFKACCAETYTTADIYAVLSLIRTTAQAEEEGLPPVARMEEQARQLLKEQLTASPVGFCQEVAYSFMFMLGFIRPI